MRRKLSILLLILGLCTSCNQKPNIDTPASEKQESIHFSTEVTSKGDFATTASIREFICFGYVQGDKFWSDVSTTATSNLMWNNKYNGSGNKWQGEIDIEWPAGGLTDYYAFFAYSPVESIDKNIKLLTTDSNVGYQRLKYETLEDVESQVDLLVATRANQSRTSSVSLAFAHALTRVGFVAFTNIAGTKINSISIKGVKYKGELNIDRDAVWVASADKMNFKVDMVPALTVSSDELKPTDLSAIARYCFNLLPQDLTLNGDATTAISITYTQSGAEFIKDYTIVEDLAKGRLTVYKVNLSGTPNTDLNVSEVIVTDWVFDSEEDMNTSNGSQQYEVFTANYNANGGNGVPATENIPANKLLTIGVAPTATPSADHIFIGYNTKADGSGAMYQPGAKISLTSNLTLFAAWDVNYVLINDIKWAKGNLIANGKNQAKIGASTDGGLYFQFGSLLGWKGGKTGVGLGRSTLGNAVFFGGPTFKAADEIAVHPTVFTTLANIGTTWPQEIVNLYYFGNNKVFSANYDLKDFSGYLNGTLANSGLGDACRYYVGNGWRMPTIQEIDELYNTVDKIERAGDWMISSTNTSLILTYTSGAELTLPAVGCREADGKLNNNGLNCYYSSSTVYDGISRYYLYGGKTELDAKANYFRHTAMPVRCVKDL